MFRRRENYEYLSGCADNADTTARIVARCVFLFSENKWQAFMSNHNVFSNVDTSSRKRCYKNMRNIVLTGGLGWMKKAIQPAFC